MVFRRTTPDVTASTQAVRKASGKWWRTVVGKQPGRLKNGTMRPKQNRGMGGCKQQMRMKLKFLLWENATAFLLALCLAAELSCALGASVIRGPDLLQGTTNSVVIRWRTDTATDSFVRYALTPEVWTNLASDPALVTEHIVMLSGLQTDTKYFYQFGSSTNWFPAS